MIPVVFISCYKETNDNLDQIEKFYLNNAEASAQVKFIHAYTPLTLGGSPALSTSSTGLRITMDGTTKINAAQNNSSSTNTLLYGGTYPPTVAYSFLPPGQRNFKFTMNRISSGNFAPVSGDDIFNSTLGITAGKKYSIFISDPYAPAAYMLEDNWQVPVRDHFAIRFVNVCGDAASRFDVVSARFGKIADNVGYKEMKDYMYMLVPTISDTIYLKTAGTNTIVSQVNTFSPGPQRVYTLYARGKTGVSGRTPNLTFYTNR